MATTAFYSTQTLEEVLRQSSEDELLAITQIFDPAASAAQHPALLTQTICKAGGHAVGNWIRDQGVPYTEFLYDTATLVKAENVEQLKKITATGLTIAEMDSRALNSALSFNAAQDCRSAIANYVAHHERIVISKFAMDAYFQLSSEQRRTIDENVRQLAASNSTVSTAKIGASAAILTAASVSGFTPYLLLSTLISTVSGGSAAFGIYTAASSVLHLLLGPPGWTMLGAAALYKFGGPNQQQCLKATLAIGLLRDRLQHSPKLLR